MLFLKVLLWLAVAVWIGVWAAAVAFLVIGADEVFDTGGRIPSLDKALNRYRALFDYERRVAAATTIVFFGLLWPVVLAVILLRKGTIILIRRSSGRH